MVFATIANGGAAQGDAGAHCLACLCFPLAARAHMATAVYIIDPDPQERSWIESALSTSVDAVRCLDDAHGLLVLLNARIGARLLVSVDPSEGSAIELVRKLRQSGNMIPVVAVGSESAFRTATDIAQLEFTDFLQRPLSAFKLRAAVRRACELAT